MTEVCLHVLASPELEEKLLDHLLMRPKVSLFVSQSAASHGGHLTDLDQAEQVLGRANAVLIKALLDAVDAENLIAELRLRYAHSGVVYWLVPILSRGAL